ncbi:MAG: hypothetical protein ACR2KK_18870 [Acidimicrobiales bacterium]
MRSFAIGNTMRMSRTPAQPPPVLASVDASYTGPGATPRLVEAVVAAVNVDRITVTARTERGVLVRLCRSVSLARAS